MKISDVLKEAVPVSAPSNVGRDYINMLNFVKSSGLEGVPPDQQVAVALFKELQKQQQKNTQLGQELSAAEKRIDQATQSGELYGQELAMHQKELDRERGETERQREKISQIDQQYAGRAQASERQMAALVDQLEQLKTKPGVDKSTAETLQNQIEKLQKSTVDQDKYKELQKNIEIVRDMQQVDDSVIQDLVAQVKDAQQTRQELEKTKQTVGRDVEQTAADVMDQVEQMRQDLERLNQVAGRISTVVADALPAQIDNLNARIKELDSESEHQYDELLKHDNMLNQLTGQGGGGGTTMEPKQPPPAPPPPSPVNPDQEYQDTTADLAKDTIAKASQSSRLARAYGYDTVKPEREKEPEAVAESQFQHYIQWATGQKNNKEKR